MFTFSRSWSRRGSYRWLPDLDPNLLANTYEVGSGGPRALRKVPKRALARVDPLKKVLLRVSALLRVLKKVLKRVPPLKRGLKKLLLGVNH